MKSFSLKSKEFHLECQFLIGRCQVKFDQGVRWNRRCHVLSNLLRSILQMQFCLRLASLKKFPFVPATDWISWRGGCGRHGNGLLISPDDNLIAANHFLWMASLGFCGQWIKVGGRNLRPAVVLQTTTLDQKKADRWKEVKLLPLCF